jgi:anaerobic ribonucleoside-triphosphate reductase activating protein
MSGLTEPCIDIGKICGQSGVNGPGKRFVIWVQGCSLGCEGCINEELRPKGKGTLMKVCDLYELISRAPGIEGVTYSGGEPFEQADGLYHLGRMIKDRGLTLMSYSGYTLDEISRSGNRCKEQLASILDILIDGRYDKNFAVPLLWRGSSNQKVHFLSKRYIAYEQQIDNAVVEMELSVNTVTGNVFMTGNLSHELLGDIKRRMGILGLEMS